jgi:uncharacterized protein (TIGR03067 family)
MTALLLATALLVPAADAPKLSEAAQKELKKLEGKWKLQKAATAGMEQAFGPGDPDLVMEMKPDGKWIFTGVDKAVVVALDPAANPKCMDLKSVEKGRDGAVDEAIYKIDGDTLTVCLYQGKGKQRPTTFDPPKERDTILVVFKRVKE